MESDFENSSDIANLSDRELRQLVRDRLDDHEGLDPEDITVIVRDGRLNLSGRVGTEGELRVAEHIVTDQVGIVDFENELVVDPIRRAVSPEAIDDHNADERATEGLLLGDRALPLSPEAEHLSENLLAEVEGTTDVQKSIEGAIPWVPPESPTPEGLVDRDASSGAQSDEV
jgi:hypothetical protein